MSAEANGTNLWSVDPASGLGTRIGTTGVMAGGGTGTLSASQDSTKLYWEVQTNCTGYALQHQHVHRSGYPYWFG